ncbi:helix-turn-helix transcriptional regulator [Allorhizobium pseudoryzae]|uniref:helix-turn-helix transcriptional regulator n=1 Tax=Allorhizobium pseudoryzae TaxID=379684 RepID=UPI003D034F11
MDKLLTIKDVAAALQLTPRTIELMVKRGDFPAPIKIGKSTRWRPVDLDAFLAGKAAA